MLIMDTSSRNPYFSVIIPNHNGEATIGACLEALDGSTFRDFEAIVVDDGSTDGSVATIRQYPCTLIELPQNSGASVARNRGAYAAKGDVLFFIDADCVVLPDTLQKAADAYKSNMGRVVGGTYTLLPYDKVFFSTFQSVFIHYSETKTTEPDYVATHAMLLDRAIFIASGGFPEDFMPILEDVEFSHRIRKKGIHLVMVPHIQVRHIFNFTLIKSLRNAARKSRYWIRYSLGNKNLSADSGTASMELKVNGVAWLLSLPLILSLPFSGIHQLPLALALVAQSANTVFNFKFYQMLTTTGSRAFAVGAILYYILLYPAAVWTGTALGLLDSRRKPEIKGEKA